MAATAFTIALTDLAFSLDSVAAAVAVSDRIGLVITGGVVGVLALRLSSGLFIRLLQRYRRLEAAGYLAVGLVGIQLACGCFDPIWNCRNGRSWCWWDCSLRGDFQPNTLRQKRFSRDHGR